MSCFIDANTGRIFSWLRSHIAVDCFYGLVTGSIEQIIRKFPNIFNYPYFSAARVTFEVFFLGPVSGERVNINIKFKIWKRLREIFYDRGNFSDSEYLPLYSISLLPLYFRNT